MPEGGGRQDVPSQDAAVQVQQKQWLDILSGEERSSEKDENVAKPNVIGDEFLAANPRILESALIQALNGNSADLVFSLAALYRKQPNHNPKLIARADALLAKLKGRTSEAVERYRTLYESDVSDDRILLDLAAAEFQDYRLSEAAAHFHHAAQRDIPTPVLENVKRFQEAVKRQTEWKWSGGISPVHNNNANNAAPRYCIETRGQTACKDGKQTVSVLPFYQAQLAGSSEFDGKKENNRRAVPYMLAHGVGIQASYTVRFGRDMQFYSSLERYRRYHRENARAERNDGWQDSLYVSLARRFGNSATVFGGWQFARFVPERGIVRGAVNNAAYNRNSINVGWVRQWQELGGLNSRIAVSYARRNYKGMAAFATEAQRNREWNVSLGLSHDRLSYKGIVPTLTYSFGKTSSNMRYAERRNSQILFGADWRF